MKRSKIQDGHIQRIFSIGIKSESMTNPHLPFEENLAVYALGALDMEEAAALRAHLQTCDSCRAKLAGYERVGMGLLSALPPRAPRPALKQALAARLPGAKATIVRRWHNNWGFGLAAAVLTLALLVGINLFTFFRLRELQSQQLELTRRLEIEQTALAMIASSGARTLALSDGQVTGSLVINNGNNSGMLIISNLPALQVEETFQIWLIKPEGDRVSAGLFNADTQSAITLVSFASRGSFQDYRGIGVTIEPSGGSDQPTGPKVLGVEF